MVRATGKSTSEVLFILYECYKKPEVWHKIYDHYGNDGHVIHHKLIMIQDMLRDLNFKGFEIKREGSNYWIRLSYNLIKHPSYPDVYIPDFTQKTTEE